MAKLADLPSNAIAGNVAIANRSFLAACGPFFGSSSICGGTCAIFMIARVKPIRRKRSSMESPFRTQCSTTKNGLEIDNPYPILAVDSAKVRTGWAVFLEPNKPHAFGTIKTHGDPWREQLKEQATALIEQYQPRSVVVEYPYLGINPATLIKLTIAMTTWYHASYKRVECYIEVPADEWQQGIMKGRFKKREQLKAMSRSVASSVCASKMTEDEADAICIGLWATRLNQVFKIQNRQPKQPQRSAHR